jgi:hypothetical protein
MEDLSCLFCAEKESTHHLLFDCMIAQQAWSILAKVFNVQASVDYEVMASRWLCNKKFGIINVFATALCWGLCVGTLKTGYPRIQALSQDKE